MFDSLPATSDTTTIDVQPETALMERAEQLPTPYRRDTAIHNLVDRARRVGIDLAGTTPTLLPDLLRAVANAASQMASDPFHAFDNNPYIMREWLIVSQVLQATATTMEQRFERLFLGA